MGNIYDGAFRTILNDCRKLVIPVINEIFLAELKSEYQYILEKLNELEYQGAIGAFDKRTIIEISNDVLKELGKNI